MTVAQEVLMRRHCGSSAALIDGRARTCAVVVPMVLATLVSLAPAHGQSLDAASTSALTNSFTLRASEADSDGAAARLRGSFDQFLPTVAYTVDRPTSSRILYQPNPQPTSLGLGDIPVSDPTLYTLSLSLPLFDGLKRFNDVQSSNLLLSASRHRVAGVEQQVLLDTGVAYLSVLRDTKILAARRAQMDAVAKILRSTQVQFAVQDATRTDVALAQSRVDQAQAAIERAQANLATSRIEFSRLSRLDPDSLREPALRDLLPPSEDEYADLVRAANPKLNAAQLDARSAVYKARSAWAELSPQVNLAFSHTITTGYSPLLNRIDDKTTRIIAKIPIYTPGTLPRISEASALARQRGYEVEDAELQLVASSRAGYERQRSSLAQIASAKARVSALRATVKGMEIERVAGFRTVLDALNLRGELGDAEVALAALVAEREALVLDLAANANLLSERMLQPSVASSAIVGDAVVARTIRRPKKLARRDMAMPPLRTADAGLSLRSTIVERTMVAPKGRAQRSAWHAAPAKTRPVPSSSSIALRTGSPSDDLR